MAPLIALFALFAAEPAAVANAPEAGPGAPPDVVVVCPQVFVAGLDPLLAHRHAQGRRFVHVPGEWSPEEIRKAIRGAAKLGGLKFVLIVGDAEPKAASDPSVRARCVPTHFEKAKINIHFGSEPEIASDNWYGDLDDDGIPELAVGRLPVDTSAELKSLVTKILAYEKSLDFGPWRKNIHFIAGVGGFGGVVDGVIESATRKFLTDGIPSGFDTTMTYGSWRSPFCPDPRKFHEIAVAKHNEGCLFWVYLGHGQHVSLDRVAVPGARFHILNVDDCGKLQCQNRSPIAIMLACYTAAFDQPADCLAESMLKTPSGPVAVYGGTRITTPYAMAVMGTAMMQRYFSDRPPALGDVILAAKREMAQDPDSKTAIKNTNRLVIDALASAFSPTRGHLAEERLEHLHLFNLLGDPMLQLGHPQTVELTAPKQAEPGEKVKITGRSPLGGKAMLELICRRDSFKTDPPTRENFDPSNEGLSAFQPVYEQANDRTWTRQVALAAPGEFTAELTIPPECRGACHVRLFVEGASAHALGAADLYVRPVRLTGHENAEQR